MTDQRPAPGRFIWCDLRTSDIEAAKTFYFALFPSWKHNQVDHGDPSGKYDRLSIEGRGIGGMVTLEDAADKASHWLPYVTVPDVEEACSRAVSLGGKVELAPMDIPKVGKVAVVADGQGARVAPFFVFQEGPEHSGPMPEGAFCFHELLTRDPVEAASFYTGMLGWTHAEVPTPLGPYHLFRRGDKDAAGMMPMPPEATGKPTWLVYIYASDVAASTEKVKELGGAVLAPPRSLPGIGLFSVVSDPTGAMFALFRSERA